MEKMTRKETKDFYKKISPWVGDQLLALYKPEDAPYTLQEIQEKCGLPPNRTSSIATGSAFVYENAFKLLVNGGFVNIKELLKKKNLTDKERRFLQGMTILDNEKLRDVVVDAMDLGGKPEQIIADWIASHKK